MQLKEIKKGMKVSCKTEEEAKELILWAYECGFKWDYSSKYSTNWDLDCPVIYYSFGEYTEHDIFYSRRLYNVDIIRFSDLIISNESPLTAFEILKVIGEIKAACKADKFENCEGCPFYDGENELAFCSDYSFNDIENIIKVCSQWKIDQDKKEFKSEWVYECYNLDEEETHNNVYFSEEKDAIEYCETWTMKGVSSLGYTYRKICRVKDGEVNGI